MQRRGGRGQPIKEQHARPKARKAPIAQVSTDGSPEQLDRLKRERDRALEQLAATAQVLQIISSSPGELVPVFQTILANAVRVCEAKFGVMFRYDGRGAFQAVAWLGASPELVEYHRQLGLHPARAGTPLDRLFQARGVIEIADATVEALPGAAARLGGARSLIAVPMLKDDNLATPF
jgi:hypothetical protein